MGKKHNGYYDDFDDEYEDFDEFDEDDDDEDYEDEDDGPGRYASFHWDYYSATRPRKVEGGIKARSTRGSIGETWWSKRWVQALESLGMGNRLTRGRSYARQGQVVSIDLKPGQVKAKVQGSRLKPYDIDIRLQPLSTAEWDKVIDAMSAQAIFAAKLLAGEMPTNIEEAFSAVKLSLFPTNVKDLRTNCSCPDWANPCKHIAAVYYILAERFDEDPFLIFKLRGRSKEEIIETLRKKRAEALPAAAAPVSSSEEAEASEEATLRLEDFVDTFWQAGEGLESFVFNPHTPAVDKAVLKRLGEAPYTIGSQNLASFLGKAYDAVHRSVVQKAVNDLPTEWGGLEEVCL